MDLPVCRSCGQSVLEEDADTCPFCGKPMKGGASRGSAPSPPSSKVPANRPASPGIPRAATPVSNSSAGSRGAAPPQKGGAEPRPRRAIGQTVADEENPFELELADQASDAVLLSPKRTKSRPYRVVCPMCETEGFAPVAAAGKSVRCANPECMVPVFKAPRITKQEDSSSAEADHGGAGLWIGVVIAALVLVGVGGTWFVLSHRGGSGTGRLSRKSHIADRRDIGTEANAKEGEGKEQADNGETPNAESKPLLLADVQEDVLKKMVAASQKPTMNRSKPYCRQSTSETFAACGDLVAAREQIERLRDVGRNVPYYAVIPFTAIAWQQLKSGDLDGANKTLDEAKQSASLPKVGLESLNIATAYATALAAAGRLDDATAMLKTRSETGILGEMTAAWRGAFDSEIFDLEKAFNERAVVGVVPLQWGAVARGLTWHGFSDAARKWAEKGDSLEIRTDCVVAWAEVLVEQSVHRKAPELLTEIEPTAAPLGAAGKACVYARMAVRALAAGDKELAEKSLAVARESIVTVAEPAPSLLPDMKGLYSLVLPDPSNLRQAALASAEIARVESAMENLDAAWGSLTRAQTYLRGTAPSPTDVKARLSEIESDLSSVRSKLKSALSLRKDEDVFHAVIEYRKNCTSIFEAADARFQLQARIFEAAVEWGFQDDIWNVIRSSNPQGSSEPWLETSLPALLAVDFEKAGKADKAAEVLAASPQKEKGQQSEGESRIKLIQTTDELLKGGKFEKAASEIDAFRRIDKNWRLVWGLQTTSRLIKQGKIAETLKFIAAFEDIVWREVLLEASGALSARLGHGRVILQRIDEATLTPTEQVALSRGLLLGLIAREHQVPRKNPTEAAGNGN